MNKPRPGDAWLPNGDMWQCPSCGKTFSQRGLSHSCTIVPLGDHFRDRPRARELFDAFCRTLQEVGGPYRLSIAKTRIGFITRMTFAAVSVRKDYLRGHFLLLRKVDSPRVLKHEHFPPYWLHQFALKNETELDAQMREWLRESHAVGSRT